MSSFFKDYFTFHQIERKGIFVLLLLIAILLLINLLMPFFVTQHNTDFTEFQKAIEDFEKNKILPETPQTEVNGETYFEEKPPIIFKNSRKFYPEKNKPAFRTFTQDTFLVSLNTADTTTLKKIYGIGSSYAKRIVKYRDLLGGYAQVSQLKEIYNFDTLLYQKIQHQFYIETASIKKINLNTADFKTLIRHPYIDKALVNEIMNYRFYQKFDSISQLKDIYLVNDSLFLKLAPYLTTSE